MIYTHIDGLFSRKQCERIKERMQGKTYFNFDIQYGGYGEQNQQICVCSDNDDYTADELKEMFVWCCLNEL
jgi:hypothetical protein